MSQSSQPPTFPPAPTMPGGDAGFDLPMMPRTWPRNIGVLSIVWGAFMLLCNGCVMAGQFFQSAFSGMMPPGPDGQPLPPMPNVIKATIVELIIMGVGFALSVLLIIAGSLLIARKMIARPLHIFYAGVSVLVTITYTVLSIQKQSAIFEWAKQNPDHQWAKQMNSTGGFAYIIIGVLVLLRLAYPLFCLIWFGLVKRNTQEITEGYEEPLH